MKILLPVLVLVLASAALAQTVKAKVAKFEQAKYYSVFYEPTGKKTTVHSPPGNTTRSNDIGFRMLTEWMEMNFPGTEPNGNATLDLVIEDGSFTEYYKNDHRLTLIVDGTAVDLGDGSRTVRKGSMFDYVETMTYRLNAGQMAALAKAKAITIRVGKFEGTLDNQTIATFRNMVSLMK